MIEWYQQMVMFWRRQAAAISFMMSRWKGVDMTSQSVYLLSKRQKPSWCLLVITMYFMPAALARRTQASASNFTGLNWVLYFSYSASGILASWRIHSP